VQRTADPVTRPAQAPLGSELNAFGQPIASLNAASGFDVQSAEPPLVNIPEGFDTEGFLRSARNVFTRLQAANDSGDLATLKEFASDDLWREFKRDIDARAGAVNHTEVLELNTQLIAYERDFDEHIASVLFAGQIREAAGAPVETFEEIWNLSRPARQGGGWVLVGIQSV
jgi:predicted lipid-binding transport protein (Tim44 family)